MVSNFTCIPYHTIPYHSLLHPIHTTNINRYDPNHPEGRKIREEVNKAAIKDMVAFLDSKPNGIAILDSTNPTHERRMNLVLAVIPPTYML